jgi:hypothetical protein
VSPEAILFYSIAASLVVLAIVARIESWAARARERQRLARLRVQQRLARARNHQRLARIGAHFAELVGGEAKAHEILSLAELVRDPDDCTEVPHAILSGVAALPVRARTAAGPGSGSALFPHEVPRRELATVIPITRLSRRQAD